MDLAATYAAVLRLSGRLDQARAFLEDLVARRPEHAGERRSPGLLSWGGYLHMLGVVAAEQGDGERAREIVARIARLNEQVPGLGVRWGGPSLWLADIAAALGDRKEAVARLQEAFDDGLIYEGHLHQALMAWAELRGDPAFDGLMRPK